ncbi:MOSC domain-containing protein [Nocardioides sp. zg-536]|uniref:MOSC domain-containing protein n=1 Tax=Nocardioides faecalis TaxID=2803858 RepID=A0A938Y7W6_9ACTN|nr:MOSC domain-containing protein [Nocardioides faecalis]MBM9458854.1 MOSC domain-containing protein [Nocardioides faecalis]MBS4754054.1 MOSC domain-containing protein [Nocardioides faecalis]QVI60260.1 MOSC domain-containing protein [Nocardioides faecalis]
MDTAKVEAIHVAKGRRLPMQSKTSVEVETGKGIVGDRYHGTKHRHVTVQSREALDLAAEVYGDAVPSHLTRRNITVSHGAVPRDPGTRIRIGDVLLEAVRVAAPCKLLDDTIGRGAQDALRRRAGTVFRVLEGGSISLGDPMTLEETLL